jgi:hypothetical protein
MKSAAPMGPTGISGYQGIKLTINNYSSGVEFSDNIINRMDSNQPHLNSQEGL